MELSWLLCPPGSYVTRRWSLSYVSRSRGRGAVTLETKSETVAATAAAADLLSMTRMWRGGSSGQWQCTGGSTGPQCTGPAATSADRMDFSHLPPLCILSTHSLSPTTTQFPRSCFCRTAASYPENQTLDSSGFFSPPNSGALWGRGSRIEVCGIEKSSPLPPGSVNTGSRCG